MQIKMQVLYPESHHHGSYVRTAWSTQVVVTEIIRSVNISGRTFYGVKVETRDSLGLDWPDPKGLLWVFDDGHGFRIWEEFQHRPLSTQVEPSPIIENIIGYHEMDGIMYFGIKWMEYGSPTWELESDLDPYADLLTDHCLTTTYSR